MSPRLVRRVLLVMVLCVWPLSGAWAQPAGAPARIYCKHFIGGYPLGAAAVNALIIRDLYALSLNPQTKLADWVCYYLTPRETQGDLDLERKWRNEPWVGKGEALEATPKDDYQGAGDQDYDRGHMAPLASFRGSPYASQVNFYSNIVPQKAALNEGPWKRLEDKVRDLVDSSGRVWVMSGPLYEREMPALQKSSKPHQVPSAFWMIVVAPTKDNPRLPQDLNVAAFIMDQETPRNASPLDGLVAVAEVEKRSKLNFFWQLPEADQQKLEASKATTWAKKWLQ